MRCRTVGHGESCQAVFDQSRLKRLFGPRIGIAIRQPAALISIASKPAALWPRAGRLCLLSRWRHVGVIAFVLLELARVRDIRGDARSEAGRAVLRTERVE